ncbi:MAG: hypothetical protein HY544_02480 [Candidatus Diapherotrites archaeon]|uniref:Uncharacterized protein n=1 Tax=Candidatus Iainarchaeum sp. TaxID=3101447 RepID=A0A8T3YKY1_9ARCH|nr:hypothetical protein [Candidatus Diapherotrites archaeon]
MIKAFASGFAEIATRPLLLVPALLGMFLNVLVIALSVDSYANIIFDTLIEGNVPAASMLKLPFYMASSYASDLLIIGMAMFVSMLIAYYLTFAYAIALSGKRKGVFGSLLSAASRAPEVLFLTVFTFAAAFLYCIAAFLLLAAAMAGEELGIVALPLLLGWMLLGVYAVLKLAFTPIAMASGGSKLKEALAQSWKWTSGRFLETALFFFILMMATILIGSAVTWLSGLTESEPVSFIILVLGMALLNSYYTVVFIRYYTDSK